MASLQQLEEQLERLNREIRAASERVRNSQTDEEARQAQADRQVLRDQAAVIDRQITEIRARTATSFRVEEDPGTGGVQIRTSDGLFVGGGFTLDEAKAAAIRNGANPAALNNLVDPRAKAQDLILGDPDWIQQGSLWAGVGNTAPDPQFTNFLSDGSINYDTQEIVFSLAWNRPADYDLDTGVMTVQGSS